jgi:hypothetical protein
MTIGADFAIGFQLQNSGTPILLSDWTFTADFVGATGFALTAPTIEACTTTVARILVPHAVTSMLSPQAGTIRLWGTRVEDGFRFQFLTAKITIVQ